MPFELCNALATFQRLMELVMRKMQGIVLVYLDDIIVLGSSFEEELKKLYAVLQHMKQANLKLNPRKCILLRKMVSFLGM